MFAYDTKILIVDDMLTMRKIVKKCLTEIGFRDITEADDGATAWPMLEKAAATSAPFQLILSDWNMPGLKGIELLKKVRSHATMASLPFVLVTAEAEPTQIKDAISSGVNSYIIKPFSAKTFEEKLSAVGAKLKS